MYTQGDMCVSVRYYIRIVHGVMKMKSKMLQVYVSQTTCLRTLTYYYSYIMYIHMYECSISQQD